MSGPRPISSGTSTRTTSPGRDVNAGSAGRRPEDRRATVAGVEADLRAGPAPGGGSYFGGKQAWYDAQLAELALLIDDGEVDSLPLRRRVLREVRAAFDRLMTDEGPSLAWDDRWQSLLMVPSEFGLAEELNDHHLQYGYWVAAASVVAEGDPESADRFGPMVESMITDFGTDRRAWNPYEGHTWASGLAPFADGNNLESISESTHAWWAAARWFTVTGQPDRAEPHLARFAIEGIVAGGQWLPEEEGTGRPWTGVVWSAKTDHATWFSAADEAALGIRLLPLGPASLAHYADEADLDAALARWEWCDEGAGCTSLWSNLLASDAAVAGVRLPAGPEPEDSTSSSMLRWWTDLWSGSGAAVHHACTVGAVARRTPDGVLILAANPTAEPLLLRCRDAATGREIWSATLKPGELRQDGPS